MNWKHFLTDPGFMAKPQAWGQKKANFDKLDKKVDSFNQKLDTLAQKADNFSKKADKLGKRLSKAGTTMTIGTVIGIAGFFFFPWGIVLIILGISMWIGGLVDLFK